MVPVIRPTPNVRSEQRGPAPHARALTATHDFTRKLIYCKHPLSVTGTPTVSYSSQQFPCSFLIVLPLLLFHKLQTPTASLLPTWLIIPFFSPLGRRAAHDFPLTVSVSHLITSSFCLAFYIVFRAVHFSGLQPVYIPYGQFHTGSRAVMRDPSISGDSFTTASRHTPQ